MGQSTKVACAFERMKTGRKFVRASHAGKRVPRGFRLSLVEPFFTGERPYWEDYPPNYTIAKRVQEMGGVVSYAYPASRVGVLVGPHLAREFPIDLALGVVNGLDLVSKMDEKAALICIIAC
jgi:hypothetical protein